MVNVQAQYTQVGFCRVLLRGLVTDRDHELIRFFWGDKNRTMQRHGGLRDLRNLRGPRPQCHVYPRKVYKAFLLRDFLTTIAQ